MWMLRGMTATENSASNKSAILEKNVRGGQGRLFRFWYFLAGAGAKLTVSISTTTSCNRENNIVLYTVQIQGSAGWKQSKEISISHCSDYKVYYLLKKMKPSPFAPRSQFCWNDATYIISKSDPFKHECCCQPGFAGTFCQVNIDECESRNGRDLCGERGTCLDLIDGFSCLCAPGYQGIYCEIDKDDCENVLCEMGARCRDLVNDYMCECPSGYIGKRCEIEPNYCVNVTCLNGGSCVPLHSSYVCDCLDGYSGESCEVDLDECLLSLPCGANSTCIDGPGRLFWCICAPGTVKRGGEEKCVDDYDSCRSSPCAYDGRCEDTPLGFICHCGAGANGRYCELDYDECDGQEVCQNGGTCVNGRGTYHCTCLLGFEGAHCELDMRRQLCLSTCRHTDVCMYNSTVTCVCPRGYTGEICENKINRCESNPCVEGRCLSDDLGDFTCLCNNGWTGSRCESAVDYCSSHECYTNSKCYSTHNGPICVCNAGYTGTSCETYISPCDRIHCFNGGTCIERGNNSRRFQCLCVYLYVGKYCEIEIAKQKEGGINGSQGFSKAGLAAIPSQNNSLASCRLFNSLPPTLKTTILTVCISVNVGVLILGCVFIELRVRRRRNQLRHQLRTPSK
ncbi:hypothetical protein EB796_023576 [Bugula neritina]|uniref:EGF-like domain-containing protein n=1 Tax=Bugula neritina TaxID=10212 RepID=A0A7J7IY24_BUGNE|nr:hypothetical protein EB796_023576 [Bugula neritina]